MRCAHFAFCLPEQSLTFTTSLARGEKTVVAIRSPGLWFSRPFGIIFADEANDYEPILSPWHSPDPSFVYHRRNVGLVKFYEAYYSDKTQVWVEKFRMTNWSHLLQCRTIFVQFTLNCTQLTLSYTWFVLNSTQFIKKVQIYLNNSTGDRPGGGFYLFLSIQWDFPFV